MSSVLSLVSAVDLAYWQQTGIKVLVILMVIPAGAIILGYVFLMKMMSHMQSRLGPMEAGPHGVLQLVADGVKFLQKEDIFPEKADRMVFALAPLVVLISTFLLFVVVPVGPDLIVEDLDTGIFFALAVSSISVIGVLMAGLGLGQQVRPARRPPGRGPAHRLRAAPAAGGGRRGHPGRDPVHAGHRLRPGRRRHLRHRTPSATRTSSPSSWASSSSWPPCRPS